MRAKIVRGGLAFLFLLAALGLLLTSGLPGRSSGPGGGNAGLFSLLVPGGVAEPPAGGGAPPAGEEDPQPGTGGDAPESRLGMGSWLGPVPGIEPGTGTGDAPGNVPDVQGGGEAVRGLPSPQLTEAEVWQQYEPSLAALQARYQGALDALVSRAYGDYLRYRTDKAKLLALVPAYIQRGTALEREADGEFNSIIAALEGDLRANHLPLSLANDLRRQYRDLKQQKRRAILNRAWELIHSRAF